LDEIGSAREVPASLADICKTIHGRILAGTVNGEQCSHILVVAAMHTGTFKQRAAELDLPRTILIAGDRFDIQKLSLEVGVRALVITGELDPSDELIALANETGVALIRSPHDTATTVLLARSAVTAERMLYADFESISPDLPLEEARHAVSLSSQFAFPVVAESGELLGILSKSDFLKPIPRQLILVDHNEMSQAVSGATEVPIVEILDHHRLGSISTESPILFMNRPVGSTSTLIAGCYQQAEIPIPPAVAGLLMAGLISDTLNLTSPTTTDVDRRTMRELSAITGIDPASLANEIFSVGSPLLTMTADQAISADCKEYEERGYRFSVAQIEELSFSHFEDKKAGLVDALEDFRAGRDLLFSALLVTDINTQNSVLIVRGSTAYTRNIDYPELGQHLWQMNGVVSRKKQLLPYLTGVLARMA
jgi:manganese-dependent inorganic pyrophosphatase